MKKIIKEETENATGLEIDSTVSININEEESGYDKSSFA